MPTASFSTKQKAVNDVFANSVTKLTEDSGNTIVLNVIANDGKGNTLWSLDDGISAGGSRPVDLQERDAIGAINYSALGAKIVINSANMVEYTLTPEARAKIQSLAAGQIYSDSFTYAINVGNGTISWATATVQITGTNDAPVVSVDTNFIEEDATSVSGNVLVNDRDADAGASLSIAAPRTYVGAYGTLVLASNGGYTYTLNKDAANVQGLTAGAIVTDSFHYAASDGTVSTASTLNITVTGTNDSAVIGGLWTGNIGEDTAATLKASGTLTISDADSGQANFIATDGSVGSNGYGTFTLSAGGAWTYSAANSQTAIQALGAGETLTDTYTALSSDGSRSQVITVSILGINDVPIISGVTQVTLQEDVDASGTPFVTLNTHGKLDIADADHGEAGFASINVVDGSNGHGQFTLLTDGSWTYSAANIQSLREGESVTDSFTAVSSDGTASKVVTVTLRGTQDAAQISGDTGGAVTEDQTSNYELVTSGKLNISDLDAGEQYFAAATVDSDYGRFIVDAQGNWTYTAYTFNHNIQALGAGQSTTDVFYVRSADSTSLQAVTITIHGADDAPTISGSVNRYLSEDDWMNGGQSPTEITTFGRLEIHDFDGPELSFIAIAEVQGSNGYGKFSLDAAGNWTYAALNNQAAIQGLRTGEMLTDSFTAYASDGVTSYVMSVRIRGQDDGATISGDVVGSITEGDAGAELVATGQLTVLDGDTGDATVLPYSVNSTYGSFALAANGSWTYTVDSASPVIQGLAAGQSLSETFYAKSADQSAMQAITITIQGANDVPTIEGTAEGWLREDGFGGTNEIPATLISTGKLNIFDFDLGQSKFAAVDGGQTTNGYGSFSIDENGTWTYSVANNHPVIQGLRDFELLSDSFSVASLDGSATRVVTVTIGGRDDATLLAGDMAGETFEDARADQLIVSGKIVITDGDAGDAEVLPYTYGAQYGSMVMASDGSWTYTADNSDWRIQSLRAGQSLTETFPVSSKDSSAFQQIAVTIYGSNDVATIEGTSQAWLTEDGASQDGEASAQLRATGSLYAIDYDAGENGFNTVTDFDGSFGKFSIDAQGNWTYAAENNSAVVQSLKTGWFAFDTFTATSVDGSASKTITVQIAGRDDAATIGGDFAGAVTEDQSYSELVASGKLNIVDADEGDAAVQTLSVTGNYGAFNLDSSGNWTYLVSNTNAQVQALNNGESLSEKFFAISADGSAVQEVTMTIHGANEVAPLPQLDAFESASFSGWSTLGDAFVADSHYYIYPTQGNYMGVLTGTGASAAQIEGFFGLANGALSNLGNGPASVGTAAKTSVNLQAGETVQFDWYFRSSDNMPYNDFAFAIGANGELSELSDVAAVGGQAGTGWHTYSYTADTDIALIVGVGVSNIQDSTSSSLLYIDNLRIV
jgi:VCBS repeat-containing protein